jgi:hypothetical protein
VLSIAAHGYASRDWFRWIPRQSNWLTVVDLDYLAPAAWRELAIQISLAGYKDKTGVRARITSIQRSETKILGIHYFPRAYHERCAGKREIMAGSTTISRVTRPDRWEPIRMASPSSANLWPADASQVWSSSERPGVVSRSGPLIPRQ